MNTRQILLSCFAAGVLAVGGLSQGTVVVHDPTVPARDGKLSRSEQALMDAALPAARRKVPSDCAEQDAESAGATYGSFTRAGAKQTIVFYQICQTGNGIGWVGLVLGENGKVTGNFVAESGWTLGVERVADIDQNGLDEFTLAYGGGMHQGEGGVGVDLVQFANALPRGIGWYQAEKFDESDTTTVWKLTARPAKSPIFYKQKFVSGENEKYQPRGKAIVTKLGKAYGSFEKVK